MSDKEREIKDRLDGMPIEEKLTTLILDVEYLRRENEALTALSQQVLRGLVGAGALPETFVDADQPWRCPCGTMLGLYDEREDVLRVRSERFHMIVQIGPGGWIQRTCHRCARIVQLDYQPPPAPSGSEAGQTA